MHQQTEVVKLADERISEPQGLGIDPCRPLRSCCSAGRKIDLCEAAAQWAEVLVACLVAEVDRSGLRVL